MGFKFMQMAMFIWEPFLTTKNTEEDSFIGLLFHRLLKNRQNMCSTTKEHGGEVYLMEVVRIKNLMETSMTEPSKMA